MHYLIKEQFLPVSISYAWDFFSSPDNLKQITPEYMKFEITSKYKEQKMYPGMIISYNISPFPGIKMKWVTEITYVESPHYFVDEQRFGPYKFCHHQHKFKEVEGGVIMTDILHYKLSFGFIGKIINKLFVKKQLKKIFNYRFDVLEKKFINTKV